MESVAAAVKDIQNKLVYINPFCYISFFIRLKARIIEHACPHVRHPLVL